jgi:hypothetical protein
VTKINLTSLAIVAGCTLFLPHWAIGQNRAIESIIQYVPSDCNSILVIDVDRIRSSKRAITETWFESLTAKFESGLGFLPDAKTIVIAANLDTESMVARWSMTFLVTDSAAVYDSIRARNEAQAENILKRTFVELDCLFVIPIDESLIAYYAPGTRAHFLQWARSLDQADPAAVAPWLKTAATRYAESKAELAFFVDLKDSLSPRRIYEEVKDYPLLKEQNIDPRTFATAVASASGFSILTQVDAEIDTSIQLDFDANVDSLKPLAGNLVQELLERSGVSIPESLDWKVELANQSIRTSGQLDRKGFGQLVSLLDAPICDEIQYDYADDLERYSDPGERSISFLKTVEYLLDELRDHEVSQAHFASNAIWLERYAVRISRLSAANVDQKVVQFSDDAVKSLIEAAAALRDYGQQAKTGRANLMASQSRYGTDDYLIGVGRNGRFVRTRRSRSYGGTGRYEQDATTQRVAGQASHDVEERFVELKKQIVDLRRYVIDTYHIADGR